MRTILFLGLIMSAQLGFAQVEDAWVYFADKENVADAIANPITILTQESLDRKNLHNINIDAKDVPVNENYITQVKNASGIEVLAKSKWFNCVFVRGVQSDIADLQNLSFVENIDYADNTLDAIKSSVLRSKNKNLVSNKFGVKAEYNYGNATQQIQQLRADYLHSQEYSGTGMIIAVMDSGFPGVNTIDGFKRVRDDGRLLDGYDFVRREDNEFAFQGSAHGTQTFSDIAGFIDNQFVGTAPDAKYYLFITEDVSSEGPKEEALWVEAIERADSLGVHVVNTSLGYSAGFDNPAYEYQTSDMDGQTAFISKGANIAFDKGMLLVSSAGNSGNSAWGIISAPGDAPGTLTVGAVNSSGNYASFSSRGPTADNRVKPDVVARGAGAAVILSNNAVSTSNGTSFSSPIMAGAVACLWQAFPSMTNEAIMQLVRESSSQYNNPDIQLGYGIPDFEAIFESLSIGDNSKKNIGIYPNPVEDKLFFKDIPESITRIRVLTVEGKLVKSERLNTLNYISLRNLSSGLYIIQAMGGETNYTLKISKK